MRDEKKEKLIQDALNLLDDELILEADEQRGKSVNTTVERSSRKKIWSYITTIAASIAVFFIAGTAWNEVIVPNQADEGALEQIVEDDDGVSRGKDADEVTKSESQMLLQSQEQIHLPDQEVGAVAGVESLTAVYIPAMKVELGVQKDVQVDMLAFFIYEGRCYIQDEYYKEGLSLVGDYVGTSVGLIDEWTTEDGYVDYAGSISGKFYEVKGYDPTFMLCMKFDNGAVETFVNNNGISLGKGADLIEDRLHLKDNFEKVTFKTQKEWNNSLENEKNHVLSEEYDELINRFLESFSSDNFVHAKDTPLDSSGAGNYHANSDNYHITFHTKDGLRFDFTLYEDGYASFRGLSSVCVQIDPSLYEEIISVFKSEN